MASGTTVTKNLIRMSIDIAATGAQDSTGFSLALTPFNAGRPVLARLEALDGTGKFKLQTAPRIDPATGAKPATGSSLWTDWNAWDTTVATTALTQELTAPEDAYWVRANVTVLHAASFAILNLTSPGA